MGILKGTSSESTILLPKYSLQQDSFFLDKPPQDVTSPSGVRLLFSETALVFQETFLRSSCSILCLCSWRLCSSSWILICQETKSFLKFIEQTQFNWIPLETYPECKPRAFSCRLKTTFIQSVWKKKKITASEVSHTSKVFQKICYWAHARQTV